MRKTGYIISLIAGICLGFCAKNSHAYMLPTIDVGAIAEGIKSNIELVKQSSIVVQATQFTGKISATLGDVKSSLTELAQSEAARMAELAKKQAENLQKAKEDYEKYKKRIEEEKAELEEGLAILNAAKGEIEDTIDDAKNAYDVTKNTYNDIKDAIENTFDDAKNTYGDVKNTYDDIKDTVEDTLPNNQNEPTSPAPTSTESTPQPQSANAPLPTRSSSSNNDNSTSDEELRKAQEEIEALKAALEFLMQQQGSDNNAPEIPDEAPEDLEEALAEIERLKALLEDYENSIVPPEETPTAPTEDEETPETPTEDEETPVTPTEGEGASPSGNENADNEKTTPTNTGGFRKRPQIPESVEFNTSSVEGLEDEKHYAYTAEVKERFSFAQAEEGSLTDDVPTGRNDTTGEFIISQELAQYCKININKATVEDLEECIKDVITYNSNPDMKVAEKADKMIDLIFYENASSLAAEAMYAKNRASHYKDDVLAPLKSDTASSQSTVTDDIVVLSKMHEQVQSLLIDLTKVYANRLYYQGVREALSYKLRDIDPEAAAALEETAKDGEDK